MIISLKITKEKEELIKNRPKKHLKNSICGKAIYHARLSCTHQLGLSIQHGGADVVLGEWHLASLSRRMPQHPPQSLEKMSHYTF